MRENNERAAEDVQLMRRVAVGDEAAVEVLYDRFASMVHQMVRRALPHRCDHEDVVQAVFVRLWQSAGRYDSQRASLVTWVMLITRRRIIDTLRQVYRTGERDSSAIDSPVAPSRRSLEVSDEFAMVIERMKGLPEMQRTVLVRAYLRGQTLREIGQDLSTPLGTVKTALCRGVRALRADCLQHSRAGGQSVCVRAA